MRDEEWDILMSKFKLLLPDDKMIIQSIVFSMNKDLIKESHDDFEKFKSISREVLTKQIIGDLIITDSHKEFASSISKYFRKPSPSVRITSRPVKNLTDDEFFDMIDEN